MVIARQTVATGLNQPMQYIANSANSHLAYVLERPGRVRVLRDDVLVSTPVLDISSVVVTDGECGLQGMTLAPDFASSRQFYLQYNTQDSGVLHTRISRYTMSADGLTASGGTPIFMVDQPYTNHKGGTIHFRDGMLFLALGDGGSGNDPENRAQNPQSLLGKVLRIDPTGDDFPTDPDNNYRVPSDNPFVNRGTVSVRGEIWDFGMRNPFRWSIDSTNGALLIADVGQDAYEEVDYEPAGSGGRNYGWRQREGLHPTTNGGSVFPIATTDPVLEYDHSVGKSIIGGFVVHTSTLGINGRYLFADYITNHLWQVPVGSPMSASSEISVTGGWNGIVSIDPDAHNQPMVVELNAGRVSRLIPTPTG